MQIWGRDLHPNYVIDGGYEAAGDASVQLKFLQFPKE